MRKRPIRSTICVLASNLTRIMNIVGIKPLIATMDALANLARSSDPRDFCIAVNVVLLPDQRLTQRGAYDPLRTMDSLRFIWF